MPAGRATAIVGGVVLGLVVAAGLAVFVASRPAGRAAVTEQGAFAEML